MKDNLQFIKHIFNIKGDVTPKEIYMEKAVSINHFIDDFEETYNYIYSRLSEMPLKISWLVFLRECKQLLKSNLTYIGQFEEENQFGNLGLSSPYPRGFDENERTNYRFNHIVMLSKVNHILKFVKRIPEPSSIREEIEGNNFSGAQNGLFLNYLLEYVDEKWEFNTHATTLVRFLHILIGRDPQKGYSSNLYDSFLDVSKKRLAGKLKMSDLLIVENVCRQIGLKDILPKIQKDIKYAQESKRNNKTG